MKRKPLEELRAFCEGYLMDTLHPDPYIAEDFGRYADIDQQDGWVVWGGYDINYAGAEFSSEIKSRKALRVNAYKAGWTKNIGDPIHSFTLKAR